MTADDDDTILTERLRLSRLRAVDADEMAAVMADDRLHEFTGGRPLTLDELRTRYEVLARGSGRPEELWLNWIVRRRSDAAAVGYLQATVTDGTRAEVAWLFGVHWQGQGFASEAARALVEWLRGGAWARSSPTSIPSIRPRRSSPHGPGSSRPTTRSTASGCGG